MFTIQIGVSALIRSGASRPSRSCSHHGSVCNTVHSDVGGMNGAVPDRSGCPRHPAHTASKPLSRFSCSRKGSYIYHFLGEWRLAPLSPGGVNYRYGSRVSAPYGAYGQKPYFLQGYDQKSHIRTTLGLAIGRHHHAALLAGQGAIPPGGIRRNVSF